MRIKLTTIQQAKKDQGLCIVLGCSNNHGKGINICYIHKGQRYIANKSELDPIKLAYDQYCETQIRYELPMIEFDRFESEHQKIV